MPSSTGSKCLKTYLIHYKRANSIREDARGDPSALEAQLVLGSISQRSIQQRPIVVYDEDSSRLAKECESNGEEGSFSVGRAAEHFKLQRYQSTPEKVSEI